MATRRQFLAHSAFSLLAGSAALSLGSPSIASGAKDPIRYNRISSGIVLWPELADALGYLDGIELQLLGGAVGGPASIQNVATDQIDFGYPFNSTVISSRVAGVKVKSFIGSQGASQADPLGFYLLADSAVNGARDLIGRKVGLNTLGAAYEALLDEYLIQGGLSADEIKQVTRVVLPPANFEQALRSKQIDLVPLVSAALHQAQTVGGGGVRSLFSAYQLLGNITFSSYVVRETFIEEKPDVLRRFVAGTAKAIVWGQTHEAAEVVSVYSKYLSDRNRAEEANAIRGWKAPTLANAGGVITPNEFSTWIRWLETTKKIAQGSVRLEGLYTNEFNPYAGKVVPAAEARTL